MDYIDYSNMIKKRITKDVQDSVNLIYGVYGRKHFDIRHIYFNDPVTVVLWEDGTKTIVRRDERDTYDPEKALAMAFAKKALGNKGNYYNIFKKWVPEEHDSNAE